MTFVTPSLLLLLSIVGWTMPAMAQPDIQLSHRIEFEIDGSREDGYSLESRTVIATSHLAESSLDREGIWYGEPYFAPFTSFDIYFRDGFVDSRDIETHLENDDDIFLSGRHVRSYQFPSRLRVGDSIAIVIEQRYRSMSFLPLLYVPNANRLREYRVEIEHPEEVRIDFDLFFPCGSIPYVVDRSDPERTIFRVSDLEKRADLPGFPFNSWQAIAQVRVSDSAGTLNAATSSEFVRWYEGLFDRNAPIEKPYDTLLSRQIAAAPTPIDKIGIIHDYVRRTIRYIADERGENAIVPRMPSLVLQRGYGDCKDRAFLVSAIARAHGLRVDPVLVGTDPRPSFDGTHVWQFDHVICAFGEGESRVYFDPTARFCEFGNLPDMDIGAIGLVLAPGRPEQVRIPSPRTSPTTIEIDGHVDSLAHCRLRAVLRNDLLQRTRWILDDATPVEAAGRIARLLSGEFQKISVESIAVTSDLDSAIVVEGRVDLGRFVVGGGTGKRYLPRLPFAISDADLLDRERDTFAIYRRQRSDIALRLSLAVPGARIDRDSLVLAGGGSRYRAAVFGDAAGRARAEYSLRHPELYIDGSMRSSFLHYFRALLASRSAVFTLNPPDR